MCGIIGYMSPVGRDFSDRLALALSRIRHRGPDDEGIWIAPDHSVGLGHRRLSIIDLSPAGHQPMTDEVGRLVVTFNGEIYNHRELRTVLQGFGILFRGSSDTEVLLAAFQVWGTDCLRHLSGMFAFAIYDRVDKKLFMARDRAGEKPLFYSVDSSTGALVFASELKALMAFPQTSRKVNAQSLDCLLGLGFVPGGACILEGCSKLPPGHMLIHEMGWKEPQVSCYWSARWFSNQARAGADDAELLGELEDHFEAAVARQLSADVPVGVLLSGGIDSSLVAAMAARHARSVKTFTVSFPGFGGVDEAAHASRVARHLGTDHLVLRATRADDELVRSLAVQFDEPIGDSSMIPMAMVSKLVREHCTVALGGDGGDELFGGYPHYPRMFQLARISGRVPSQLRNALAFVGEMLPMGMRGTNWLSQFGTDFESGLLHASIQFSPAWRRALLPGLSQMGESAERVRHERIPPSRELRERAMLHDFENYLPEDILVKVDRASMLFSLEVRAPFLDRDVVEFACRLPTDLKTDGAGRKIILQQLARKLLPDTFDVQRKQGFSIPMSAWLRQGPLRDLCWTTLTDSACVFDRKATRSLLRSQDMGLRNGERIFLLTMFELWRRAYNVTV